MVRFSVTFSRIQFTFRTIFSATNFSKIIAELETTQQTLTLSIGNNKALLQGVQEAFAVNLENVNKEVTKLEERMNKVINKK